MSGEVRADPVEPAPAAQSYLDTSVAAAGDLRSVRADSVLLAADFGNVTHEAGFKFAEKYTIEYNPSRLESSDDRPPVAGLFHEFAHVYDYGRDTSAPGTHEGNPGGMRDVGVENDEREAVGLPIDDDNDPNTAGQLHPKHPVVLVRRKLLAGLASLLSLAACAEAYVDYEPEPPKPAGAAPKLDFHASIYLVNDGLSISYEVTNRDTVPVVAYTGVIGDAASHEWDVFITARKDGTVEIAKRTFTIPPGVNVEWVGEIEGRVVAPGEQFRQSFRVPLPLTARRPYKSPAKLPDQVKRVVFCLGAIAGSDAPAPRGDRYPLNGPQHLFCSPPVELPAM